MIPFLCQPLIVNLPDILEKSHVDFFKNCRNKLIRKLDTKEVARLFLLMIAA